MCSLGEQFGTVLVLGKEYFLLLGPWGPVGKYESLVRRPWGHQR